MPEVADIGTLRINAILSTKTLAKGIAKARASIGSFVGGIGGLTAGLGVAAVASTALGKAMSIENQVVGLGKATNLTGDQLQGFRDSIVDLATGLRGVRTNELLEIATAGSKLGVSNDQLIDYTKTIAMLSTAMDDVPVSELSDSIGILTNIFKLDAADGALKLGSAIDALADSAATSGGDLINTFQRMAGSAQLLGLGADQAASLATALLDTGTSAEKAGGVLNRTLIALADKSRAVDFAKLLGVTPQMWTRMLRDEPLDAVQGFLTALKGKDLTQVGSLLGSVGITSGEDVAELAKLSLQVDKLSGFLKTANAEFLTGQRVLDSYSASTKTTQARLDQLYNQFDKISIIIGDELLPIANKFLDAIIPKIDKLSEGLGDASNKVGLLADVLFFLKPIPLEIGALFATTGSLIAGVISTIAYGIQELINLVPGMEVTFGDALNSWAEQAHKNSKFIQKEATDALNALFDPSQLPSRRISELLEGNAPENAAVAALASSSPSRASLLASLATAPATPTPTIPRAPAIPAVAATTAGVRDFGSNLEVGSREALTAINAFRNNSRNDDRLARDTHKVSDNTAEAAKYLEIISRKINNVIPKVFSLD